MILIFTLKLELLEKAKMISSKLQAGKLVASLIERENGFNTT